MPNDPDERHADHMTAVSNQWVLVAAEHACLHQDVICRQAFACKQAHDMDVQLLIDMLLRASTVAML